MRAASIIFTTRSYANVICIGAVVLPRSGFCRSPALLPVKIWAINWSPSAPAAISSTSEFTEFASVGMVAEYIGFKLRIK